MSTQILIIASYFLVLVAIGFNSKKHLKSSLAFQGIGLGVMMSASASAGEWLGGTSTIGVSEYGFDFGISGSWYTIANGIGMIFLALFFAKLYRSMESVTIPGIIGKLLGRQARIWSSVFLIFVMLAVGTSQMIAAGSLGMTLFGLNFITVVIGSAVIFITMTLSGGMIAIAKTHTLHLVSLYGGAILALILSLGQAGGVASLAEGLPAGHFDMTAIGTPKIFSWVVASLLGACTAQASIQPILAAKDARTAKRASLIAAVVVAPFGILTALLGMVARLLSDRGKLSNSAGQAITDGKQALPALMLSLPPVASGIIMASILAAILATISSIILASGTMFTRDIYQSLIHPKADERRLFLASRISTATAGLVCAIAAIFLNSGSIRVLDIVYFAYSIRGALFVIVLLGLFWKRTSPRGAVLGMISTVVVGCFWVLYNKFAGHFPINAAISETYASISTALVSTILFSMMLPKRKEEEIPRKTSN